MIVTATLLLLALIGAPLFVIVGVVTGVAWIFHTQLVHGFTDLTILTGSMEGLVNKDEFLAIPLFMASGAIMTKGGLAKRLVDVMAAGLGWLPGGLAVASVAACMVFAAISGSSPVTLIAVGSIMFPAMVGAKYPENFSLGLVMTAGSLGCLVPPAIAMLIYAIAVSGIDGSVDPSMLFLAGLVPAVLIAGVLAFYSIWVGQGVAGARRGLLYSVGYAAFITAFLPFVFAYGVIAGRVDRKALWTALVDGIWALLLPLLVLGGIYVGLYTPSRAGAVAVVYALVITMLVYRELDFRGVIDALAESGKLMGMLILIIGLAFGLNDLLAMIKVQDSLKELIARWDLGPVEFMLLVNVVLIVLGALMDSISATLIFAPMLAPIAVTHYGMDPYHFGIVFVVNMEIGYLAPPVATNLFVAAAVFKKPFGQVSRAILPGLGMTCAALVLFMYVPTCSKGLVNVKMGQPVWESFPWDGKPQSALAGGTDTGSQLGDLSAKHADEVLGGADAGPAVDGGAGDDYDEDDPLGIGGGGATTDDTDDDTDSPMDEDDYDEDDPLGIGGP